ncbi:MAG: endonuclease/exonuclease/phosphatase family protein [Parvularculaceae bacterium]|nr:endonuclease/exonuclease/phosphatase family protein [Parvularculaceae bacterium]
MNSLIIATLNTWKCDGRYQDRLGWMADGLFALQPDIVLLQEAFVCAEMGLDTAQHLADYLNLHVARLPGREKARMFEGRRRRSFSDLAILHRMRPLAQTGLQLPQHKDDPDRQAQRVEFDWRGIPLAITNVHLTHRRGEDGDRVREQQVLASTQFCHPPTHGLALLAGDFNATPSSAAIRNLTPPAGVRKLSPRSADRRGTFQGENDKEATLIPRIDHLFVYKDNRCNVDVTWEWERVEMNVPVGPQREFPSDHAAVVAKLSVDTIGFRA